MKKINLLIGCALFASNLCAQIQKGSDIQGEIAGDLSGRSVSMPDANTIAIGAASNDGNGTNSGHTRIYSWNGTSWTQKGADIDGEAAGDLSGTSVVMPDANTVAIGAPYNDGAGLLVSGHVRVYSWTGTAWAQKGIDLDGEANTNYSGIVSMPNANTIAIGANQNNDNGNHAGHVRIYTWNGIQWVQKGIDIDGEAADDLSGSAVDMPNENTVAIGAPRNNDGGIKAGHVRIYSWNGIQWVQKGIDIDGDGNTTQDHFGASISMLDENTIAIGANENLALSTGAGYVKVYVWTGTEWVQKGATLIGEAIQDKFGSSVSMPSANTLAVGAIHNDDNGTNSGHVRIFSWNGTVWSQQGADIEGDNIDDYFGGAISMPDQNTLAVGATGNDGNGISAGHVKVFDLCVTTTGIDLQTACDTYDWIDGNTYTASNSTATHTLTNAAGCDSIVILNLTINNSNTGIDTQTACDTYDWIDGNTYTSSNSTATHTLTNAAGCDSIVTLNLTINNSNTGTDTQTACDTYDWIDGNTYTSSNSTATHTLTNAAGCDSIVTLNLTINNSNTGVDTQTACDTYDWIDGNTYTASNSTATHTLTNAAGCDSIVTLNLTINNSNTGVDTQIACDTYDWIDGNTYNTSNSTATHTLTNAAGCDSIVTLNLTINNSNTGVDTQIACDLYDWIDGNTYTSSNSTATHTLTNAAGCDSIVTLNLTINNSNTGVDTQIACDTYDWIDGNTYTSSNSSAMHTLTNAAGCDSVVTLDLTIVSVDISTTTLGLTISATATGVDYQWLDCLNNSIFPGEISQSFTPASNGDYAVIITGNGCADTSACVSITTVGVDGIKLKEILTIHPNPSHTGIFKITIGEKVQSIEVFDLLGRSVNANANLEAGIIDCSNLDQGEYMIVVRTISGMFFQKIMYHS